MDYDQFLTGKIETFKPVGFEVSPGALNSNLYPWQREVTTWAIRVGRPLGALAVGLGKTIIQVEVMKQVERYAGGRSLIVCPLAVAHQTIREASRLSDAEIVYVRSQEEADKSGAAFCITNQEYILKDRFDPAAWVNILLDEASKMLKAFTGKTRQKLTYEWTGVPFRSAWTATPAPNRLVELLNYAEFLGVMTTGEALTRWFIRDSQQANHLRLKGHSEAEFWGWLASWCVMMDKPSAIGYSNEGYELPPLHLHQLMVEVDQSRAFDQIEKGGQRRLFLDASLSATNMWTEKRLTADGRARAVARLVAKEPDESWLIWCETLYEEKALAGAIPGAVVVTGSQDIETKERLIIDFLEGRVKCLITKPSICGFGLNAQFVCSRMAFVGLTHKWEQVHQALGRIYRFKQERACHVYMVYAESEINIIENIQGKNQQYREMMDKMSHAMKKTGLTATASRLTMSTGIEEATFTGREWTIHQGDAVKWLARLVDNSIHLGISSWPFSDQYLYSPSVADFGNNSNDAAFFEQADFLLPELYRVTIPGRLQIVHAKDRIIYGTKNDGYFEIEPFSDNCIRAMRKYGFLFVGRVTIHTDVVRENNQTNRLGYGRLQKDASTIHVGMPEYLLLFRKPHTKTPQGGMWSDVRVHHNGDYSLAMHQVDSSATWRSNGLRFPFEANGYDYQAHIAYLEELDDRGQLSRVGEHPLGADLNTEYLWSDIQRTAVLNGSMARSSQDERHICPLQLDLIERCINRWSSSGEVVLDYFVGVGSVVYRAILQGRKGIGIELKPEYAEWAARYCREAELETSQLALPM